jgi:tetratricopeptide (TPR) repeat protein
MRSAMDVSLARLSTRILLVAGAVACAGALSFAAGRVWLAAHWAGTRNPADWARAARLEPGNAAYWSQLGLYEQWDFANGNLDQAIADFQHAARLDPRADRIWMALAGAYEEAGRIADAQQAYEKALAAHPISAEVAWRYGNFLLRQGDAQQAAQQVHRALLDKPDLATSAVSQFWKAGADLRLILDRVLPARPGDYIAAADFFISQQNDDAALAAWERLSRLGLKVRLEEALGLVDDLIAHNRVSDAAEVWRQALTTSGRTDPYGSGGSLIFNGGFEADLIDGGFGWRETPVAGTAFDLVSDVTHESTRSARVTFDGSKNVDYSNLFQYVAVTPGERYRFSAYMRTDDITTDSGPQFVLLGGDPGSAVAQTPALTGTHPWTEVQTEFTAGPNMHGLMVVLRRAPSNMFANKIRGTVWVDDVRLEELPANREQGR